jgi:tripartite ATP-independent transporter DctP family solute receptor
MKPILILVAIMALVLAGGIPAESQEFNLKMTTVVKAPHPWISSGQYIQKALKEKSGGKITLTLYDGGRLGSDEVTLTSLRDGTVDLYVGGSGNVATYVPELSFFNLSFLFKNQKHFEESIKAGSLVDKRFREITEGRKVGFEYLALAGGGLRNMSNRLKPVRNIADIKGMKMRVPGGPVSARVWKEFGTLPVSLPWTELYTALQTGVVDACESTVPGYRSSKLYEVAKHHAKTEHEFMVSIFLLSEKTYQKMPANYQTLVRQTVAEAAVICTDEGVKLTESILADLGKRGVQITEVDKAEFITRSGPVQNEEAAKAKLTDLLESIRKSAASF